jgi:hypothetical protein
MELLQLLPNTENHVSVVSTKASSLIYAGANCCRLSASSWTTRFLQECKNVESVEVIPIGNRGRNYSSLHLLFRERELQQLLVRKVVFRIGTILGIDKVDFPSGRDASNLFPNG